MNGTTKAPIVNNLGETVSGAMTVRAFEKVPQFKQKNLHLVDVDASLFFHTFIAYEWLVLRLETLCAIILSTSAFLMVVLPADRVDGGKNLHFFVGCIVEDNLFYLCWNVDSTWDSSESQPMQE